MRTVALRALPYALVGGVAAYLFYAATLIEFHRRAGTLGPDFWPKLLLGLLVATCVYEVLRIALSRGGHSGTAGLLQDIVERSETEHGEGLVYVAPAHRLLLVAGIVLTALYVWIIQRLGFFLATVPYIALFIALGGYRRWAVNAAVSLIGTLLIMFFFMKVVYISLPLGGEPFSHVTLALMRLMGIR